MWKHHFQIINYKTTSRLHFFQSLADALNRLHGNKLTLPAVCDDFVDFEHMLATGRTVFHLQTNLVRKSRNAKTIHIEIAKGVKRSKMRLDEISSEWTGVFVK